MTDPLSKSGTDLMELRQSVGRSVLRLRIHQGPDGSWEGGTVFMVSPTIALTAYHNLPSGMPEGRCQQVEAVHADDPRVPFVFELIREGSHERHDLAALRLRSKPPGVEVRPLRPACLPPGLPLHEALRFWQGRRIAVYGFPFRGSAQADRWVVGVLHTGQPLEQLDLGRLFGGEEGGLTLQMRGLADNAHQLPGCSGAPIIDTELRRVVGVLHSYLPRADEDADARFLYGTPLCRLQQAWPGFLGECGGLLLKPVPARLPQQEDPEDLLQALRPRRQPRGRLGDSRDELISILALRAREVENWFREGMAGGRRRPSPPDAPPDDHVQRLESGLGEFRRLHQEHMKALRKGELAFAHEVLTNILKVLRAHDYGGPYFAAPNFREMYPGPRERTQDRVSLYAALEDPAVDPADKGAAIRLLVGFGENDFSRLRIGPVHLDGAALPCSFSQSDLAGSVLRGVTLSFANLSEADLRGAVLSRVDLSGARLRRADLRQAVLHDLSLGRVDLKDSEVDGLRLVLVREAPPWLQAGMSPGGRFHVDRLASAIRSGFRDTAGVNLSGADLEAVTLTGLDLHDANLRHTNLRSATLCAEEVDGALRPFNLTGADLSGADMRGAHLTGAQLDMAEMSEVRLAGAFLSACTLTGTRLQHADLRRASLKHVRLVGATLAHSDLSEATLENVSLERADLSSSDLTGVDLGGGGLRETALVKALVAKANRLPNWLAAGLGPDGRYSEDLLVSAIRAGFRHLAGANLGRASLSGVDLAGADLSSANLQHAFLAKSNLSGANLRGASLRGAWLSDADLSNADASGADFESANLAGAQFGGARLAGATFGSNYGRARDIPRGIRTDQKGVYAGDSEAPSC